MSWLPPDFGQERAAEKQPIGPSWCPPWLLHITSFPPQPQTSHGGARRKPRDQLRARLLNERTLEEDAASLAQWGVNVGILRACRQERFRLTFAEERDWLWAKIKPNLEYCTQSFSWRVRYKVCGIVVSRDAFIQSYGIGESRVKEYEKLAQCPEIVTPYEPKSKGEEKGLRQSETEIEIAAWQDAFIGMYADEQPNKRAAHLDSTTAGELWTHYKCHCVLLRKGDLLCDQKLFLDVWNKRFIKRKAVSVRKTKGVSGGHCYDCARIKLMGLVARTKQERVDHLNERKKHRCFHGLERQMSARRFLDSEVDPMRVDTIAFDIWDVSKLKTPWTCIGNIAGAVGDTDKNTIRNRVQGFLSWGPDPLLQLRRSYPNTKKGANLTVTQLSDFIHRRGAGVAPTVNFEIDGGSKNQNKTLIAYYAYLVLKRTVKRVRAWRLPIKHTHNRLDKDFGKGSQGTRGRSGARKSAGVGALSQQDWARNVIAAIPTKKVEVSQCYHVRRHIITALLHCRWWTHMLFSMQWSTISRTLTRSSLATVLAPQFA